MSTATNTSPTATTVSGRIGRIVIGRRRVEPGHGGFGTVEDRDRAADRYVAAYLVRLVAPPQSDADRR